MTNNEAATILNAMKALYADADGVPISSAYTALEKALILLVQVPDNHGDLIDRNKLLRDIEMYHVSDGKFQYWVELQDAVVGKDDSMPCWADGPDGCEELTYHGMAECLRHCAESNGADCRSSCDYVEKDTGACLHECLLHDAAAYLDQAAMIIKRIKDDAAKAEEGKII